MTFDQGVKADMSTEHAKGVVGKVRGVVEGALRESFGKPYDVLGVTVPNLGTSTFEGRLSTDPQRVDPTIMNNEFL